MSWEQSGPDPTDSVLVAQAKAGSEAALVRLTARYYQPIRQFLLRRTGDPPARCADAAAGQGDVLVKADTIGGSMSEVLVRVAA